MVLKLVIVVENKCFFKLEEPGGQKRGFLSLVGNIYFFSVYYFILAVDLEAELGEEPLVLARVVGLLENLLDLTLGLAAGSGILGDVEVELNIEGVAGREEVSVVDHLEEGLDARAAGNLTRN